jgi:hypothetical protein
MPARRGVHGEGDVVEEGSGRETDLGRAGGLEPPRRYPKATVSSFEAGARARFKRGKTRRRER